MERPSLPSTALESGLARANARLSDAIAALGSKPRLDLSGLPSGAVGLFLARAARASGRPILVVTPDLESARSTASDLAFFAGESASDEAPSRVLVYPGTSESPYLEVAPDRRASMDRLSVLFHLAAELPFEFVVAPAGALLRRVPPREAIRSRSRVIEAETEIDRDDLVQTLTEAGYLRVPVAEDPGTFAVRGGILDIYPPSARYPARVELDDWLVLSIKHFDPEDQRTLGTVDRIFVHPVRDVLLGTKELSLGRERIRDLCDAINLPTARTRQLLDDLESGRLLFGLEGLLPAFYPRLDTILDYLPSDTPTALLDPTAVARAMHEELERAERDRAAKASEGSPAFPLEAHYLTEEEALAALQRRTLVLVHRLAIAGRPEDESPFGALETVAPDDVLLLGAEDQAPLVAELKNRRSTGKSDDTLLPVARKASGWLDAGLRVFFTARTRTQAERLATLLRGYDLPVGKPEEFTLELLGRTNPGRAEVVMGGLAGGFVLATEGLAFVTEEEIFGTRAHRRAAARRDRRDKTRPFLEDLRELKTGDYVVHVDHGVGRYLGLERKVIAQSASERMRGDKPLAVEVLVVEYGGGDRLFLPVTRLNQIQKFAGQEGHKPKLDKLGGQTFAKTKARVRREVKQLADELLVLYAKRAASHRDPLSAADRAYAEFEATFPFEETPDQSKAIDDVLGDLERGTPMDRLVCGDVGFGKTEVALRAAFRVAMSGKQVAMLCPTTVLAQQHFLTCKARMGSYPLRIEVLSRFVDKKSQAEILAAMKEGKVDVVVGTHRLLSKDVHFKDLGLLIVDEEQRFGVGHKERIKQLRAEVDVLTLSATPIPRTLQLAIGGLRDLSLITTAPVDRRAVRTLVCRWDDHLIKEAIDRELSRGGQVFFVYNRIEGLYERAHRLTQLLPKARIAVAHGQMKEGTLERVMTDFVEGQYDVLCSTAIVESGLDIPRANTILIDRADTFGLAQLYQLRGRVGRARERAYCYLITPPPTQMSDEARFRIEALERFTELGSGFQVASLDMELRGAGDLLGAEQSGTIAAVGFDLFVHMLEEAVAQLKGEPIVHEVDPELTLDVEHYLPDDYIDDVGLRLSFYKRLASAENEADVEELAGEMEDRFGPPPEPAVQFIRAMTLKPGLRRLRVLGCEATAERVTLHLREDTLLDPQKVLAEVARPRSPFKLSPDMKLTRRYAREDGINAIDRVAELLREARALERETNGSSC